MSSPKKYFFTDFGCRLNQFETRVMENSNDGLQAAESMADADFIVINTCTVTGRADMKNRQAIRKARSVNPDAHIIVTGCYATTDESSLKRMKEVDTVIINQNKFMIPDFMAGRDIKTKTTLFPTSRQTPLSSARAYVKIQDGCNKKCSYCKIPMARGEATSRTVQDTIDEVTALIRAGFHELVLTGINIGHYQSNGAHFNDLLRILVKIPGDYYYRISSIEPECVNEELLSIMANTKFAPFLHLPLQSGSAKILKLMGRSYTPQKYIEAVNLARSVIPDIHLGTDIMAGFPSESEDDFMETLKMMETALFANIHFFPYSKRPGSKIENIIQSKSNAEIFEVNGKTIKERIKTAMEIQKKIKTKFIEKSSGNPYRAIIDTLNDGRAQIVTENYLRGSIPVGRNFKKGDKVMVTYDRHLNYSLV